MRYLMLCTVLLTGCNSFTPPPSFREDPYYYAAPVGLAFDLCTTRGIRDDPRLREREGNLFLPAQPSDADILLSAVANLVIHHVMYNEIEAAFPGKGKVFSLLLGGAHVAAGAHNMGEGLDCP